MSPTSPAQDLPFYLKGNFAPVPDEITASDLPVTGAIPPELCGLYLRNGPNPKSGTSPHWFAGDGMLHGIRLENGRADWYRNRWVRTRPLAEGGEAVYVGADGTVDRTVAVANTNVIGHAKRILALVESSYPTEVTPELDTVGIYDYEGRLRTAMTAHPKLCPETGELHFFGYGFAPPFLTYHVADAAGKLVRSEVIEVPGPTMMHDFAITRNHVVFMDLPVVFSPESLATGIPYRWSDDYGARVGIMPRGGASADVRWIEVEPCYVFHPMNAYEDQGRVIVDVARYDSLWRETNQDFERAHLHRWTLDPAGGTVKEQPLDDRTIEFPRVDERRVGLPHRYGYAVKNALEGKNATLVKYDLRNGRSVEHDFGPGTAPGEGVMVPVDARAGEEEGYVLALVHDARRDASDLAILDATRFEAGPVATVHLPRRVPFGFHGNWLAD